VTFSVRRFASYQSDFSAAESTKTIRC
jgi:hypothetical protein